MTGNLVAGSSLLVIRKLSAGRYNESMRTSALERFLRYVQIDTRSDDRSSTSPSTPGQLVLLNLLRSELQALGVADASINEHGVLMATVPDDEPPRRTDHRLHCSCRHVARNAWRQREADRPSPVRRT